jgi:hypothetical protein
MQGKSLNLVPIHAGCAKRFHIVSNPPVPESLLAQPTRKTVQTIPLTPLAARAVDPDSLPIKIDHHRPRERVPTLIAEPATLLKSVDTIDYGVLPQPAGGAQWRQICLAKRARDTQSYILIHDVVNSLRLMYIMGHVVGSYNEA